MKNQTMLLDFNKKNKKIENCLRLYKNQALTF